MNKYFVYALASTKSQNLYIGQTNNLTKRYNEHNRGKVISTKPYIPYELLYFEEFRTRKDALLREKELKTSTGRRFLKQLMK